MLMLNKGGRLLVTCTEQIWSQTELLRGGKWQQEKNSVAVQASKMRRYELNSEGKLGAGVSK